MLIPFAPGAPSGSPVFNAANEVSTGLDVRDCFWNSDGDRIYLTVSNGRIYQYTTQPDWRVGALTQDTFRSLTASVAGSPEFYASTLFGGNYFALRAAGTGETFGSTYIEKYNSSGTAQQKLIVGSGFEHGLRMNTAGTRIFVQDDNVIREIPLSSAGDLTTAGSVTNHTFGDFSRADGFDFNDAGTRLYINCIDPGARGIRDYTLPAFNLASTTFDASYSYTSLFAGSSSVVAAAETGVVTVGGGNLYRLEV